MPRALAARVERDVVVAQGSRCQMWRIGHAASQSPEVDWHTDWIALNTHGGFVDRGLDRGLDRRRRRAIPQPTQNAQTQDAKLRTRTSRRRTSRAQNLKARTPQGACVRKRS